MAITLASEGPVAWRVSSSGVRSTTKAYKVERAATATPGPRARCQSLLAASPSLGSPWDYSRTCVAGKMGHRLPATSRPPAPATHCCILASVPAAAQTMTIGSQVSVSGWRASTLTA